jgi:hypothetical protein
LENANFLNHYSGEDNDDSPSDEGEVPAEEKKVEEKPKEEPPKPKKAPKPLPAEYIMKAEAPKAVDEADRKEEVAGEIDADAMGGFDAFDDY